MEQAISLFVPSEVLKLGRLFSFLTLYLTNNFHPPAQSEPDLILSHPHHVQYDYHLGFPSSLHSLLLFDLTSPRIAGASWQEPASLPCSFSSSFLGPPPPVCGLWPQKWFLVIQPLEKELERRSDIRPFNAFCSQGTF